MRRARIAAIVCAAMTGMAATPHLIHLPDFPTNNPYTDTVRFRLLTVEDNDYYRAGDRHEIKGLITDGDAELTYRLWMQESPAPLVIIVPGLGGHYANSVPTALGERLYNAGNSVAIVSNPFNWEFVKNASSRVVPGYTPRDAHDLYRVVRRMLAEIRDDCEDGTVTETILLGYSLGAIDTLFVAMIDTYLQQIEFDRFVALSPPVNLLYGMIVLDTLYNEWRDWDVSELEDAKNKAVNFYRDVMEERISLEAYDQPLPFTERESRFAIGYLFRRMLTETIKAIQQRHDFGILETDQSFFSREEFEKEAERYGYLRYVDTFVRASMSNSLHGGPFDVRVLNKTGSLPALSHLLSYHPRIRVLHTVDDFLTTKEDREWLGAVLGDRIAFFDRGGHLGYFSSAIALSNIVWTAGGSNVAALARASVPSPVHESVEPIDAVAAEEEVQDEAPLAGESAPTPSGARIVRPPVVETPSHSVTTHPSGTVEVTVEELSPSAPGRRMSATNALLRAPAKDDEPFTLEPVTPAGTLNNGDLPHVPGYSGRDDIELVPAAEELE